MKSYEDAVKAILSLRDDEDAPVLTWPVAADHVLNAEALIGRPFPHDLKAVWSDIGMGFFHGSLDGGERLDAVSCLMAPPDVADLMVSRGWVGEKAVQFPFFNEDDEDFILLIETADGYTIEHEHGRGPSIAVDLREFVQRMASDPAYWRELMPRP